MFNSLKSVITNNMAAARTGEAEATLATLDYRVLKL
jgi:hypothetical protein